MRKLLPLCLALGLIATACAGMPASSATVDNHDVILSGVSENAVYNLGGMPQPAAVLLTTLGAFVLIRQR